MAKYTIGGREVTEEEFNKAIKDQYTFQDVNKFIEIKEPFFLDEALLFSPFSPENKNEEKLLSELRENSLKKAAKRIFLQKEFENLKNKLINSNQFNTFDNIINIIECESEEELETILRRNMNIGAPDWSQNDTGGTVFERLQDMGLSYHPILRGIQADPATNITTDWQEKAKEQSKSQAIKAEDYPQPGINTSPLAGHSTRYKSGQKESQTVEKAPVFTYCKQMKNAIEVLALRSLYGHKRYEKGDDWENFSRVENGDFEYSNAEFRHALGIGEDSDEDHYIAAAWNAVARLEIYLRNKK